MADLHPNAVYTHNMEPGPDGNLRCTTCGITLSDDHHGYTCTAWLKRLLRSATCEVEVSVAVREIDAGMQPTVSRSAQKAAALWTADAGVWTRTAGPYRFALRPRRTETGWPCWVLSGYKSTALGPERICVVETQHALSAMIRAEGILAIRGWRA